MKIKQVHIDGFGKWHDQDFSFTNNPVLIYGANEAGKTTLAAFILSILFGFADGRGKNKYQQYIPKDGSSYGGSLTVIADQHQYVIKRVKGKNGGKVTVTNEKGKKEKQDFLAKLLGPLDRELYQAIYSFNQNNILNDELDREQLEQHLQRLGAVGSQEWLQQIARLEKAADSLYKPRGRKLSLNRHLKEYDELRERVNQAQSQSSDYHRLVEEQVEKQSELEQLKREQPQLKHQVEKEERLQRLWPIYDQWQNHQKESLTERLTDDEIIKVQELQSRERELNTQLRSFNQQQLEQQAVVKKLSDPEVNDYRSRKAHYQQLKDQLLALQIQKNGQTVNQQEQWYTELKQLAERYGSVNLPEPLSERAVSELEGLLRANSQTNNSQNLFIPGIGIVLFILGLILRQPLVWICGIIALGGAGVLWFKQQQREKQLTEERNSTLQSFGKNHNLTAFPTSKWLMMQGDLHRYHDLRTQLEQADKRKTNFDHQLELIKQQLPVSLTADSLNELINSYQRWLVEMQDQLQRLNNVEQELTRIQRRNDQLTQQLIECRQAKETEYKSLGIKNDNEFKQLQAQKVADQTRKVTASAYGQQLTTSDRQQLAHYDSKHLLDTKVSLVHQNLAANEQKQTELETALAQINVQINALVQEGSFSELNQKLTNLQTVIWNETKQWLSSQLAIRWINGALKLASQDRYPKILQQAEKFFAILTADRYQKIVVDDNGINVLNREQQIFQVAELSLGTAEQLFISLRLGFITVISDQIKLPVMVDDGFVNFDNVRRGRMLKLLNQMAEENQVIYFTANDQIKKLGSPVVDLDQLNKNKV